MEDQEATGESSATSPSESGGHASADGDGAAAADGDGDDDGDDDDDKKLRLVLSTPMVRVSTHQRPVPATTALVAAVATGFECERGSAFARQSSGCSLVSLRKFLS